MHALRAFFGGGPGNGGLLGPPDRGACADNSRRASSASQPWAANLRIACSVAAGVGLGFSPLLSWQQSNAALALEQGVAAAAAAVATEPKTGVEFSTKIVGGGGRERELAGMGVRSKNLFGIKSIKIYAYGVYADPTSLKDALGAKYSSVPTSALKDSKWLLEDAMAADTAVTVRLVIFYKNLKIGQVRSAFQESVGNKLKTISGAPQPQLLDSFTKLFSDDIFLHKGTVIDLSRSSGHILTATIDGKECGSVKSAVLCRALFDLYIGEHPFDASARDATRASFAKALGSS